MGRCFALQSIYSQHNSHKGCQVTEFFRAVLQPAILIFLIPLAGIALGALKLWFNHQERMEKIRHGIDPDAHHR